MTSGWCGKDLPWNRTGKTWCRRGESNPRPRDYETLALPLSYAGIAEFFMLRILSWRCQGIDLAKQGTRDLIDLRPCRHFVTDVRPRRKWFKLHAFHHVPHLFKWRWTCPMGHRSPIGLSTTVPLTLTVLDSILHGIEHQPTHHEGRKPNEKMGGGGMYRYGTGS